MRSITNHDTLYPSPVGAWQNRLYTQEEYNGHTHLPCHTYFQYDITLDIECLRVKCPICLCLTPNLQCRVFSRDRSSSISRSSSSSDSTSSTSISSRTSSSNRRKCSSGSSRSRISSSMTKLNSYSATLPPLASFPVLARLHLQRCSHRFLAAQMLEGQVFPPHTTHNPVKSNQAARFFEQNCNRTVPL